MTPTSPDVKSIFGRALDIASPQERAAYLDEACAHHAALRAEVEGLLAAIGQAGDFMGRPAAELTTGYQTALEGPGTRIGPYKLLQPIGEGGMGVVYMAEQEEPVRRKVALKIIKPGMDSRQVIARFEAERQALALMDHTNIARVYDAGTTANGRPYFVMELVHGVPITAYCDENKLTPRERLELFVPVCQAIQHAHQKGIIHRDIKPSNVLVTMYDDRPVPKVIDFGVAKAVEQRLTEKTLFTQYGTLVGTFEYMSPEQAELNAFGVDTRSDIYSLGVLLYELLTGTTPLERQRLRLAAFDEVRRLIKEEEPPRPSVRLSTSGALAKVAAARKTDPAKLSRLVRGELDWVVMKCLEKDRTRRYETANGLARDLQRFLTDEPVEACPPSAGYRLKKAARKHRQALTVLAAFALLLVVGLAGVTWKWRAERRARADADIARVEADQARKEAEQRAEELRVGAERLNAANARLERANFHIERQRWREAEAELNQAIALRPDHYLVWARRANLYHTMGLWDLAAQDVARAWQLGEPADPFTAYHHAVILLECGDTEGYQKACARLLGRPGEATAPHRDLIVRSANLSPDLVVDRSHMVRLAEKPSGPGVRFRWYFLYILGTAQFRAGDFVAAEKSLRESLTASTAPMRAQNYPVLALTLHQLGRPNEARDELANARRALDDFTDNLVKTGGQFQYGQFWYDWVECRLLYREAHRQITNAGPPPDARSLVLRARAARALGKLDLAERAYALAIALQPDDPQVRTESFRLWTERKQWDRAEAELLALRNLKPTETRPLVDAYWSYARAGRWELADAALAEAIRMQPENASVRLQRFLYHHEHGNPDLAEKAYGEAVGYRANDARYRIACGDALAGWKMWSRACAEYGKAVELGTREGVVWMKLSILQLYRGDQEAYRRTCALFLERWEKEIESDLGVALLFTCLWGPDSGVDPERLVQLARRCGKANPGKADDLIGCALLRAGRHDEALPFLLRAENANPSARIRAKLALVHHHRAETGRARHLLRVMGTHYKQLGPGLPSQESWEALLGKQLAYQEAEAIVRSERWDEVDRLVQQKQWADAIRVLNPLLSDGHRHAPDWVTRGNCRAELRQWNEAAADYARALNFAPTDRTVSHLAMLFVRSGQRDRYRRLCAEQVARYERSENLVDLNWVAWMCTFDDPGEETAKRATAMAEKAAAGDPRLAVHTLAYALYRAGRYEEVLKRIDETIQVRGRTDGGWDWLGLAMAHHRLGHAAEARKYLDMTRTWHATYRFRDWYHRAQIEQILAEAEALIDPKR